MLNVECSFQNYAFNDFLVNVRVQHAHEREIAVTLGKIKSVADDKKIGDFKAHEIRLHVVRAARGLVQQHAGLDAARLEQLQLGQDTAHGFAGVENVIHQQDVAATHIQPQFLGEYQVARFGAEAVTGHADEIEAQWQVQMPDQIREEQHGAVEQRDDNHFTPAKVALDFARQRFDAPGNLLVGDEDFLHLLAPARRDGSF